MPTVKETMTSRERVLAALNHRQPDRVPLDLGGNQTGIHKFAYQALVRHLGRDEEIEIMDAVQQLARPSEAVLERLRIDTRYVHAGAASDFDGEIVIAERDGKRWHDLTDEFGVRWSMPDDSPLYMDITHHPLAEATIDDLADYAWPQGGWHQRSGLRDLLVHARARALVHGHA
jgi:uroporphyrinogen decarboxylase